MKLKPCPFCGGPHEGHLKSAPGISINNSCAVCATFGGTRWWNTRPVEDQLRRDLEEMAAIVGASVDCMPGQRYMSDDQTWRMWHILAKYRKEGE